MKDSDLIQKKLWQMSITPEALVDFLNGMLKVDPQATAALFSIRMPCKELLADHPTVQVSARSEQDNQVGVVGVLNGAFGILDLPGSNYDGFGAIGAIYDDGQLKRFVTTAQMALMDENPPEEEDAEQS